MSTFGDTKNEHKALAENMKNRSFVPMNFVSTSNARKAVRRNLTIKEVVELLGISRATIYRMIALYKFPLPIKRSLSLVGWRLEDLGNYVELGPDGWYEKYGQHQQAEKLTQQA